ncbi:MAG: hypothetical protein QOI52_2173 [Chloroflexota bacterium]|nr:hypothetical protein [Chloroflexota bacterium]
MSSVSFRAKILRAGKTATGIEVPAELVAELGSSRRPAVHATIAGHAYRTSVAMMRGRFMLPVSAAVREQAGVAAGEEVDVELELDTAPREVELPADFELALRADGQAAAAYDGLSYSRRLRLVSPIGDAKAEATRQRRIAKAIDALREGRA